MRTINVAMIGFGGIAQIHRYAYWLLAKCGVPVRLVAACDSNPEKFRTKTKINLPLGEIDNELPFAEYYDMETMLASEDIDVVDICLPTKFHADITIDLLKRGYRVLCEKPMAVNYADCCRMLGAPHADSRLMIGQCLRFYPEYEYLHELVLSNRYGKAIASEFYRYSPPPYWSDDKWQMNVNQSGGCLTELNIHDIDCVRWIFGEPESISCKMETRLNENDYVESAFTYGDHHMRIHSGWLTPEDVFVHGYEVRFETAVVKMRNGEITVEEQGKEIVTVPITVCDGIIGEIYYFVKLISWELENTKNPPSSSAKTILLIETLRESANQNSKNMVWRCTLDE